MPTNVLGYPTMPLGRAASPEEASQMHLASIPGYVFDAFNELIARKIGGGKSATVGQDDVIALILQKAPLPQQLTRNDLFNNKWLDIEDQYREAGWTVKYDKPAYSETYAARFIFTKK